MKTLYLDIFSGISGDMFVAAMIDLGTDPAALETELRKLALDGYSLQVSRKTKSAIAGAKFDVVLTHDDEDEHDHGHRHLRHIEEMISGSTLSDWVKRRSIAVFTRIANAEGQIHGMPPDKVHFHEVGAIDSIVDIVGASICLELLGKPRVLASNVIDGSGWIDCAHGRFPVPAPATLAILGARGIAITQCDEPQELVTPTGAALLAEFVAGFGPMHNLVAERIGFGLGTRENKTRPNVLRAILGQDVLTPAWETDRIAVLETNLDDCTGEVLGHFVETALLAGALDVFHTPIQMKKNRPGVLLTVLCAEDDADRFSELMLRETTTFGVRKTIAERSMLSREIVSAETSYGTIQVKIGRLAGKIVNVAPEYESVKKLATVTNAPLREVFDAAVESAKQCK